MVNHLTPLDLCHFCASWLTFLAIVLVVHKKSPAFAKDFCLNWLPVLDSWFDSRILRSLTMTVRVQRRKQKTTPSWGGLCFLLPVLDSNQRPAD